MDNRNNKQESQKNAHRGIVGGRGEQSVSSLRQAVVASQQNHDGGVIEAAAEEQSLTEPTETDGGVIAASTEGQCFNESTENNIDPDL